jgi:8-oxo-dGTP pyrophosphatase MutT (NUDIX family)
MFSDKHIIGPGASRYKKHIGDGIGGGSSCGGYIPCTNCGIIGHSYKSCMAPVNSYGIIAFRFRDQWDGHVKTEGQIEGHLCMQGTTSRPVITGTEECGQLEFLLIRRKDSLRFVEFVRGKYDVTDEIYLTQMLSNMTDEERGYIAAMSFEDIWRKVWGTGQTRNYKNDYEVSKRRFQEISESGLLAKLIAKTKAKWATPEWGFPKGRRNPRETDFECAVREFKEETGLVDDDFKVIRNMQPLCETFYGDNHVHYCHKYYLAFCGPNAVPKIEDESPHQEREIGDIRWMSVNEAIALIRDENIEKREILLRASSILRNFGVGFV